MEKKKFRLNVIDWVIIAVVLVGVAFGGYKFLSSRQTVEQPKKYKYTMLLDNPDVANEFLGNEKINVGDKLIEKTVNAFLGNITDIDISKSRVSVITSDGELLTSSRPSSSCLTLTVEGEGVFAANGGLLINGTQYFCNKSYEVLIGDSSYWLRIVEINRIENS